MLQNLRTKGKVEGFGFFSSFVHWKITNMCVCKYFVKKTHNFKSGREVGNYFQFSTRKESNLLGLKRRGTDGSPGCSVVQVCLL